MNYLTLVFETFLDISFLRMNLWNRYCKVFGLINKRIISNCWLWNVGTGQWSLYRVFHLNINSFIPCVGLLMWLLCGMVCLPYLLKGPTYIHMIFFNNGNDQALNILFYHPRRLKICMLFMPKCRTYSVVLLRKKSTVLEEESGGKYEESEKV